MPRIASFQNFEGVLVPVGEDGRYLRWDTPSDKEAPLAQGEYGPNFFGIGRVGLRVYVDWVEMPNGFYLIQVSGDTDLLTLGHLYVVFKREEVLTELWRMTEQIVEDLKKNGVDHDYDTWLADEWYCFRTLAAHLGKFPWSYMEPFQLRWDDSL